MQEFFDLTICIPLVPAYTPQAHLSEYINKGIENILTLDKKIEIIIPDIGQFKMNVFTATDDPGIKNRFPYSDNILLFQISIPNTADKIEIYHSHNEIISPEERIELFKLNIVEEFKHQSFHLLVFSNIAFPGAIKTREGLVLVNKEIIDSFPSIYSIHRESLDDIKTLKWPTYKTLSIHQVCQWFESNHFSFRTHSKTKVARALNAFTYLFKHEPGNMAFDLFWSLIGVEALYCSSKDSISEQIYEKVQLVLGPVTESKKKIKGMYNFRSRLVHGDLDIPPNNFDYEDTDEEKFQTEMFEATIMAVAILTTTLQEIIIKNETDLKFKYVLEK